MKKIRLKKMRKILIIMRKTIILKGKGKIINKLILKKKKKKLIK